jgi:hypothetical protein
MQKGRFFQRHLDPVGDRMRPNEKNSLDSDIVVNGHGGHSRSVLRIGSASGIAENIEAQGTG